MTPTQQRPQTQTQQTEPMDVPTEPISYTQHDVTGLFDILDQNALKAERTYQNQYVELTGFLSTIYSDGKYFSVNAGSDNMSYFLDSIHCSFTNDEQVNQIIEMSSGDPVVVRGQITDIGEILGYMLDVHSIG